MNVQNKEKGFTIIEVVLVLAIAGLIFLMVFIALPALQRNQRDTARKNDVSVVAAAVTSYTSNNRGTLPTTATITGYLNDLSDNSVKVLVNTTAGAQTLAYASGTATASTTARAIQDALIVVTPRTTCGVSGKASNGDPTQTLLAGTARQFTVVTMLEGGSKTSFCQTS